ncbi:hypothetical protein, partial [Sulfurimonas sp.]
CCERVDREYNDCTCGVYNGTEVNIISKPTYEKGEVIWVREPAGILSVGFDCFDFTAMYLADEKTIRIKSPKRFVEHALKDGVVEVVKYPNWLKDGEGIKGVPSGCIKEMARIFLKITDVRVERLKDTTVDSIKNEGCNLHHLDCTCMYSNEACYKCFRSDDSDYFDEWVELWDKTAPKGYKWEDNPYVFVYEFKRVNRDGSDYE